jgi:flagellar biosynthesis chaperone FliJ
MCSVCSPPRETADGDGGGRINYEDTHNTLKYANRAKEIKTKITANVVSVNMHVSQYKKVIEEQRQQIADLREIVQQGSQAMERSKLVQGALAKVLKTSKENFQLVRRSS